MQQVVKTSEATELWHDVDVGDFWNNTHQKSRVWMTQNALHHDLILDLLKKLISEPGVEDFLDGDRSAV